MNQKDRSRVQAENNGIAIGEINISGTVTGNINIGHTIIQAADSQLRRDLGILLQNVQTTWIKGCLERSVHEAARLDLGMEIRDEAVDDPWRMVMEAPDQTRETLPRGKRIKDIFYEANGLLLILGEPGSGKTTTLLQLARDLIAEVDQAFTQPVPVILNLSTWTNKQQPLAEWLVAELNSKYRVPKKDGKRWLEARRLLLLLDGLDEVRAKNRAACVEKINQLVKEYGLQAVVCSRIQDYLALNVRLGFYRAIHIQSLTPEQVDEYLAQTGDKLASLRTILQRDNALKSMAQSPLILHIMSLAYQNSPAEGLSDSTLTTDEARRRHLFDTYISRMFKRKVGARPYDDQQTKQRLSWLACNMQEHHQEVFLMESLQPSWLPTRPWQWLYVLTSRLVIGLGLALTLRWAMIQTPMEGVIKLVSNLILWLVAGLSIGLSIGLTDILRFEWLREHTDAIQSQAFWWTGIHIVTVGLVTGIAFEASNSRTLHGLINPWLWAHLRPVSISATEISSVLVGTVVGIIVGRRGSLKNLENDIFTVETLRWSWRKALQGALIGAPIALLVALLVALRTGVSEWRFALLLGGLIGAFFKGLSREIVEVKAVPNQGIRLSIRNAIVGGLLFGLVFGLLGFANIMMLVWPIGALWYGGFDIIQHYTLRLILLVQGHTPANYARFLDYAVDRIFLQKVGGGYRFIHRLLLEHFADMSEATKKS